jgi:hypothetical protein
MRKFRSTTMVGLAALALLAGCASSGGDPAAPNGGAAPSDAPVQSDAVSCDEFAEIVTETLPLMFVMIDTDIKPPEVASAMRELSDRWSGFTPPEEIAGDWPEMTEWADAYAEAWEAVPADADQQDAFTQIQAEHGELDEASDAAFARITEYIEQNCPQE